MLQWSCKSFSKLTVDELYKVLQLRSQVFVVEQNCVYQDCDNKDPGSFHLMGWKNNTLVAYARLLPAGLVYSSPSIGRVVTSPSTRRVGIGRELMRVAIEKTIELFRDTQITISAQVYLKSFYTSLGFQPVGEVYLEDNIEHIRMIYS